jgi:acyl carrier protein
MNQRKIIKIIYEKLLAFGFDSQEAIEEMNSVSYLALIVDLERKLGVEFPEEYLSNNAFRDIDTFATAVKNLLPQRGWSMFKRIVIISHKNYNDNISIPSPETKRILILNPGKFFSILHAIIPVIGIILAYMLITNSKELIVSMFFTNINNKILNADDALKTLFFITIIVVLSLIIGIFIHEVLHIVSYPKGSNNDTIYVITHFPFAVKVRYSNWGIKWRVLLSYLFPFLFISAVSVILMFVIQRPIYKLIPFSALYTNLFMSISDIINAIYIGAKAPPKSKIRQNMVLIAD